LVQMDTSIHEWLEGRGEAMVLVAMIDDATSRIEARFYEGETVEAHFDLLGRWLRRYGRPLALYTDRDSIFQAPTRGGVNQAARTQFSRALEELGIELILASSPQAKGRVERFFQTAQDRWVRWRSWQCSLFATNTGMPSSMGCLKAIVSRRSKATFSARCGGAERWCRLPMSA